MNNIGFKIKKLREIKNISQEEFAYNLDISQSTLSKIENGTVGKIDFIFMQKVCDYFEVHQDYFLDGKKIINEIHSNNRVSYHKGNINTFPEELLKNVMNNQEQITKLIEIQNKLIKKLLNN